MSYSSLGCMAAQAFFVSLSNQQSALSIQPARSCAILKNSIAASPGQVAVI
jgi:hypothetical protein